MKIIQKFDPEIINSSNNPYIKDCQKGTCIDWDRKLLIQNLSDGKLAVVSLNFFERIICALQQFFCFNSNNYFKSVFETKNIRVIPSENFSEIIARFNTQIKPPTKIEKPAEKNELFKTITEKTITAKTPQTKTEQLNEPAPLQHLVNDEDVQDEIFEQDEIPFDPNPVEIRLDDPEATIPDDQDNEEDLEAMDEKANVIIEEENKPVKSIEELIQEGGLDEALEATEKTYPFMFSEKKNFFLKEIAKAYFKLDNFEKTYTVLWKLFSSEVRKALTQEFVAESCHTGKYEAVRILSSRDNPFCEIFIQNLIQQGNLDEALKACKAIGPIGENNFYKQLANAYFELNNFEKSYEALNELGYAEKEALCKEYAYKCCREGHFDGAKTFVSDTDTYCKIFLVVADEHYQADRLDQTMDVLYFIRDDNRNDDNEILALKVAEKHIANNNLHAAAEILEKIIYLHRKDQMLAQLASLYFEQGDLENALRYNIYNDDYAAAKLLYIRVAEAFNQKGDRHNALEALKEMTTHGKLIDVFNLSIAKDYIEAQSYDNALKTIMASKLR